MRAIVLCEVAGAIGVVNIVYAILKLPETLNFEKNPGGTKI